MIEQSAKMSERMPIALVGVSPPPMAWTTVCSVYSGLVPRSPKTTPSADNPTHFVGRPAVAAAGIELLVVMDSVFTAISN